ncbi:MAG: glycogen synthase GlgA [Rhodocyclaceae bacterium]|nr:glycogen synthase GlgA [Rhodocyclaceae bacterium]
MKVLFAVSELAPWVKTGGLGDVAAALPPALEAAGAEVRVLVPRYPAFTAAFPEARYLAHFAGLGGQFPAANLFEAQAPSGQTLWLIDCPPLFHRFGNPYHGPEGHDWLDNPLRFGLLSRIAARLASRASPLDWRPDILHCHDWQTGLAPYYLKSREGEGAASVMTIHNLAFQGVFSRAVMEEIALGDEDWHIDGVEYYGHLSFLKAGLRHADLITTVSPTYAREIQTDAEGMGMAGLLRLRADRLVGILNGIDTAVWNPALDAHLAVRYDRDHLEAKAENKRALQREMGLVERDDAPLFGIVSRLTYQKGLDLVAAIADALVELPAQLAVLGSGEKPLEAAFRAAAARHPGQIAVKIGYDEPLAHRIEAGADIFLMPSRFEPCGLNQMYSLAYGTPPLVRATGGLADTVVNYSEAGLMEGSANGFVCEDATPEAILGTLRWAASLWQDKPRWRQLQRNAMSRDFSWAGPARQYLELYRRLRPQ